MYHRTYLNTPLDLEERLEKQLRFVRLMGRQIMCDRMGVYKKFNNYSCKLSGAILQCSWFFDDSKRSVGFLSVFFFTGSRFVHAAFDLKAKVRKAVSVNRFSLSERSFLIMRFV